MGLAQNETPRRHDVEVVPPANLASPVQMPPHDDVQWWTPGWRDLARHVGWRWIFALPAVVVIGLMVGSLWTGYLLVPLWMMGIKVIALSLLIPILLLLEMARHAMAARKEPFCIHCGYGLTGLPDHHNCPECGCGYSFALIEEYRRDPHWFRERYRMRGEIPMRDAPFSAGRGATADDGT